MEVIALGVGAACTWYARRMLILRRARQRVRLCEEALVAGLTLGRLGQRSADVYLGINRGRRGRRLLVACLFYYNLGIQQGRDYVNNGLREMELWLEGVSSGQD